MNFGYIDMQSKAGLFSIKPKVYSFETGRLLYIFPAISKEAKLNKITKKYDVQLIPQKVNHEFKERIYIKIILQVLKETDTKNITFSFENAEDNLELLIYFFKREIPFVITDSLNADKVCDFFLDKFGHPVTVVSRVRSGLFVYEGGNFPAINLSVIKLDLAGNLPGEKIIVNEYNLKNINFPIKINSIALLNSVLTLTGKEISDIIIKPCIIRVADE